MFDMEELIWGIATTAVQPLVFLLSLGFIFDYIRTFIFKN